MSNDPAARTGIPDATGAVSEHAGHAGSGGGFDSFPPEEVYLAFGRPLSPDESRRLKRVDVPTTYASSSSVPGAPVAQSSDFYEEIELHGRLGRIGGPRALDSVTLGTDRQHHQQLRELYGSSIEQAWGLSERYSNPRPCSTCGEATTFGRDVYNAISFVRVEPCCEECDKLSLRISEKMTPGLKRELELHIRSHAEPSGKPYQAPRSVVAGTAAPLEAPLVALRREIQRHRAARMRPACKHCGKRGTHVCKTFTCQWCRESVNVKTLNHSCKEDAEVSALALEQIDLLRDIRDEIRGLREDNASTATFGAVPSVVVANVLETLTEHTEGE